MSCILNLSFTILEEAGRNHLGALGRLVLGRNQGLSKGLGIVALLSPISRDMSIIQVLERERVRLLHNFHAESVSKGEGSFGNRRPISSCIIHIPLEEGAKLRFQKGLVDRLLIIDNHRRPIVSSLASTPSSGFFYFSGKFKRTRNVDDRKNVKYYWERSTWIMKRHIASYYLNPR